MVNATGGHKAHQAGAHSAKAGGTLPPVEPPRGKGGVKVWHFATGNRTSRRIFMASENYPPGVRGATTLAAPEWWGHKTAHAGGHIAGKAGAPP